MTAGDREDPQQEFVSLWWRGLASARYRQTMTSEGDRNGGYVQSGIDSAERYATTVHDTVAREFDALRSIPPIPKAPIPLIPENAMFSAANGIIDGVGQQARVVDAAIADSLAGNARALGVAVPSDIAQRAAIPEHDR